RSRLSELDDDLYVVRSSLKRLGEVLRPLAPCYEMRQPRSVRSGQGFAGLVPMPLVGIDTSDNDIVFEHCGGRDVPSCQPPDPAHPPPAGQAPDPSRPDDLDRFGDDLADTRALDENIRFEAYAGD